MKKQLLFALLLSLTTLLVNAQCTPNIPADGTHSHIYPDTIVNLPHSTVGVAYGTDLQFYIGTDTVAGGYNVHIVNSIIDSITGLPAGFGYTPYPANGTFPGGSSDCLHIYGAAPSS